MASKVTIISQYRTFNHLYLFKSKSDQSLTLKIFDQAQEELIKTAAPAANLSAWSIIENAQTLLSLFIQSNLIPPDLIPSDPLADPTHDLQQLILHAKSKVSVETDNMKQFTCPITLEVFEDPVIDDHGHTFEKTAIESERQRNKNLCPISREPIALLAPNRDIKKAIDEWKKQDPIPTLALFKNHNPVLFGKNLETAKANVEQKEYEEALECYSKAFMYTRDWRNYVELPKLYEAIGDHDKAALAYLYLTLYQLQDGKPEEAIKTLEHCKQINPSLLQIDNLLIQLYHANGRQSDAIQLALQCAKTRSQANPQEAIRLYKQVLAYDPLQWIAYGLLSRLLPDPQQRAHILLKGALHALESHEHQHARAFAHEAEKAYEDSFIDRLIDVAIFSKQKAPALLKAKLLELAKRYEEKKLYPSMVKAYKMLTRLEYAPLYYQKMLAHISSPEKPLRWNLQWLSAAIENKDWETAEHVALSALRITKQPIPIFNQLEIVYTHWHDYKLSNLWSQLGKAYIHNNQVDLAERTYQKAYDRFHTLEQALALGETLVQQNRTPASVQTYYEASLIALLDDNIGAVDHCVQKIREIDPGMAHLNQAQKIQMITQRHISRLSLEVQKLRGKIEPRRDGVPFGEVAWKTHWGDPGIVKPLPGNIEEILDRPCPIWPGKKIRETHTLNYRPKTVNGKPLSLDYLGELVKKPLEGHKTKFTSLQTYEYKSDTSSDTSYWFLMTRDEIPGIQMTPDGLARMLPYEDKEKLLATYGQNANILYEVPTLLDVALSIFGEKVRYGTHLYEETYIVCQEKSDANWHLAIGGFGAIWTGLSVTNQENDNIGVGGMWKL